MSITVPMHDGAVTLHGGFQRIRAWESKQTIAEIIEQLSRDGFVYGISKDRRTVIVLRDDQVYRLDTRHERWTCDHTNATGRAHTLIKYLTSRDARR